jgi:uncharacterized protein YjbJ (UPF0337 family)
MAAADTVSNGARTERHGQRNAGLCHETLERMIMNWDTLKGKWKEVSGKVKEKWGKLTDDDISVIAGKRDQLVGKLQQRYGYEKQRAEKELDEFARTLKE